MAPNPTPRYLTLAQVAELLAVPVDDILDLIHHGRLRGARIGTASSWRVEQESLETYLEEQHEESRRMALWRESNEASFPELWGTRPRD